MSGLFITATDTGVGKTFVTSGLAAELWRTTGSVGVFKPFASGSWEDTDTLIRAAGHQQPRASVTPVYFHRPLAPIVRFGFGKGSAPSGHRALNRVQTVFRELQKHFAHVLVEGVGGVLVPLWENFSLVDLVRSLNLPVWVVARPGLGTLNHTLLTIEALERRRISVRRILLNGFRGRDDAEKTNGRVLKRWTGLPVTPLPWVGAERSGGSVAARLLRAWMSDFPRRGQ